MAKDLLVDALRETLAEARGELDRARRRAERAADGEAQSAVKVHSLKSELEVLREQGETERRAFRMREEAWAKRCTDVEPKLEAKFNAMQEELRRTVLAKEETLRVERQARFDDEARHRTRLADTDNKLAATAALVEKQKSILDTKDRLIAQLQADVQQARDLVAARDKQVDILARGSNDLRDEIARLRAKSLTNDDLRDEISRLRAKSLTNDDLRTRLRLLEDEKSSLAYQLASANTQIHHERDERAKWAQARIDVLTHFNASSSSSDPLFTSSSSTVPAKPYLQSPHRAFEYPPSPLIYPLNSRLSGY